MHSHIVHVHRDREFLEEAVREYLREGFERGDCAIVIARPELRRALASRFGVRDDLCLLDAEQTLARFMRDGMPGWHEFHAAVGGLIAQRRLEYPGVVAYGEMVDVLWQRGEQDAAMRLEEYWNELGRLQTFSLLCAYGLDPLEETASGALERICRAHSHLVPARDTARVDAAVAAASSEVLGAPLSRILISLANVYSPGTRMPSGQSMLLWLKRNMPGAAERVLDSVRKSVTTAP